MSKRQRFSPSDYRPSARNRATYSQGQSGRIIAPTDFRAEEDQLFQPLDESIVAAQAGQYFTRNIGTFGQADPTEKVGDVINQQIADEHPASHNVSRPASHQKEGDLVDTNAILQKAGITPDMIEQAQHQGQAGTNDEDDDDYGSEDELAEIFGKMGVDMKDGHYTRK